jgi:membrane-bound lytic murein transglycosylase MltF
LQQQLGVLNHGHDTKRPEPVTQSITKTTKDVNELINAVKGIHPHVKDQDAEMHVKLAEKYADPVFPKKEDILAVMGIESHHKNGLKSKAGALGLMQVDPKAWKLDPTKLKTDKEYNIKNGVMVLKTLYDKFGDKESAIKAYNVGARGLKLPKYDGAAKRYWAKFKDELSKLM